VTKRSPAFPLSVLALAIVAIVAGIKLVLRVPGVPYNVSSLFLDDANVAAVVFFALTVLWIGAGAALVAFVVTNSRRPYAVLPLALVAAALVSKVLVSRGVTYESLDDILGTNNLFDLVTRQGVWGDWWRSAFLRLGADVVDFLERRVRYCALYSIPLVAITAALLPRALRKRRPGMSAASLTATIAVAAIWLWLCEAIVLRWAATDNLTELIAVPVFLLVVFALVGVNAELLQYAGSVRGGVIAIAGSALGVVAAWYALNAGLDQHVQKYSAAYSATQFLLGPDRRHELPQVSLFVRWVVVYAGAVGVIAVGVWIAERLTASVRATSPSGRGSAAPGAP